MAYRAPLIEDDFEYDLAMSPVSYPSSSGTSSDEQQENLKETPVLNINARVLTQLLKQKTRENRQLQRTQQLLATQHANERARADTADRRALELATKLRKTLDDLDDERRRTEAARAELALYKVQLDAQQRIVRDAQHTIDELAAERDRAETDAARARTTARQLKEQLQVREAYDDAFKEGLRSGLHQRTTIDREAHEQREIEAEEREWEERERRQKGMEMAREMARERAREAERQREAARERAEQERAHQNAIDASRPAQAQEPAPAPPPPQPPPPPQQQQQQVRMPLANQSQSQWPSRAQVADAQTSARPYELRVKTDLAPRQTRVQRGLEDVLFSEVSEVADTPPDISAVSSFVNIPTPKVAQVPNSGPSMPEPIRVFHPPVPTLTTPFHTLPPSAPPSPPPPEPPRPRSTHPDPSRHGLARQHRRRHTESIPAPPPRNLYREPDPRPAPVDHASTTRPAPTPPPPVVYTPHPRQPAVPRSEPQLVEPQRSRSVSGRGRASPGASLRMPDGWIPRAQDLEGDGRFSIHLPPPHELAETARSEDQFELMSSPEDGGQSVIIPSTTPRPSSPLPPPPTMYNSQPVQPPRPPTAPRPSSTAPPPPPPPVLHNVPRPPSAHVPPPPSMHSRDQAQRQRHLVPPQQYIFNPPVNESRASTLLSEYDMLQAPQHGPPVVDDGSELEYPDAPPRPTPGPFRPASRQSRPSSRQSRPPTRAYVRPPSRGPPRPREIVLPTPLAPRVERPPSSQDQIYARETEPSPPSPPPPAPLLNPHPHPYPQDRFARSRTQSSGIIPISVQSPSPDTSPTSPTNGTVITQPDLLSPEYTPGILPSMAQLSAAPQVVPVSTTGAPSAAFAVPERTRPRGARRGTYEAAPVPENLAYPASPLRPSAPSSSTLREPTPRATKRGPRARGNARDDESEASTLLSPLGSDTASFLPRLADLFPGRKPWRRNTTRK